MDRRSFLTGAAVAAGTMASPLARATAGKPAKRPNLIYVFADQLRYSSCGYAGDSFAKTPNMDKLASQGCNVHQAVSSTPVCAPYRASLMTGKYQSSTGMVINELRLSPEHQCFGTQITKAGYKTAYIGKWHMWANSGKHALVKSGFVPPGPYRLGFDEHWAAYNFNHNYMDAPYFNDDATPHLRPGYEPNGQTDEAIAYLKEARTHGEPFAMFLSWGPPHYPWGANNVEKEFLDQFRNVDLPLAPNYSTKQDPYADNWGKLPPNYDTVVHSWLKTYYAQVANLDWNLGRLMKAIDDAGLADDTILVFTSDHGEMFGSHGRMAKLIFYEEAARVPFLVRWPGKIRPNTKTDCMMGTPDIMPTLLSLLKIPVPSTVEGIDQSRNWMGHGGRDHDMQHLQGMGPTAAWRDGHEWRATRDREFTYAKYKVDGKELLFHNAKDPYQMKDLSSDRAYASTLAHYRASSEKWRKEHNDSFENCTAYKRWIDGDNNIINTATGIRQDIPKLNTILAKWLPPEIGDKKATEKSVL